MELDFKGKVLAATDLVELIGRSVVLSPRGKDHAGLCPFHSEKTPSFVVSSRLQFFCCFGCKLKGNAINFVMRHDRIGFSDALFQLAATAGIEKPPRTNPDGSAPPSG